MEGLRLRATGKLQGWGEGLPNGFQAAPLGFSEQAGKCLVGVHG